MADNVRTASDTKILFQITVIGYQFVPIVIFTNDSITFN